MGHSKVWLGRSFLLLSAIAAFAAPKAFAARPEGTSSELLERLRAGNARFASGDSTARPPDVARRAALAKGQAPYAMIVSCADSRVTPESVFDAGSGELFVVRVAGEVVDGSVLASVEYAVEHLGVGLVVVLGHESCGLVKAAVDGEHPPAALGAAVAAVRPALDRVPPGAKDRVGSAIKANVEQVVNDLYRRCPVVSRHVEEGTLTLAGGYYEFESGRVLFTRLPVPVGAGSETAAKR